MIFDGKVGEYIVTARKKDNDWFIGGMSNWAGKDLEIDFSFVGEGSFEATMILDGVNADRYPSDHTITRRTIDKTMKLKFRMARGGGMVLILKKKS